MSHLHGMYCIRCPFSLIHDNIIGDLNHLEYFMEWEIKTYQTFLTTTNISFIIKIYCSRDQKKHKYKMKMINMKPGAHEIEKEDKKQKVSKC